MGEDFFASVLQRSRDASLQSGTPFEHDDSKTKHLTRLNWD